MNMFVVKYIENFEELAKIEDAKIWLKNLSLRYLNCREMRIKEFGHSKGTDAVSAENLILN